MREKLIYEQPQTTLLTVDIMPSLLARISGHTDTGTTLPDGGDDETGLEGDAKEEKWGSLWEEE